MHRRLLHHLTLILLFASFVGLSLQHFPSAQAQDWVLSWSDEFNGALNTRPDPTKWTHDTGFGPAIDAAGQPVTPGWGNREEQEYVDRVQNSYLDGQGHLVMKTLKDNNAACPWTPSGLCQYTSARLKTKDKVEFQYGKVEARLKIAHSQGVWPAFWMLGENFPESTWPGTGEIDIMEIVGKEPGQLHGTLHGPGYSGCCGLTSMYQLPAGQQFKDDFHTFGVEWEYNVVRWYLDGALYATKSTVDMPAGSTWAFNHPFYLLLNTAVGGNDFNGPTGPNSIFPQTMLVDYVRVYQRASSAQPTAVLSSNAPYLGTPWAVPGTIEAENFDNGGPNIAYSDTNAWNQGGVYRNEGVDVQQTYDAASPRFNIGWAVAGEWVEYTVNTAATASYDLSVRVASGGTGGTFHLEQDGVNVSGPIAVPDTGGWDTWTTVTKAGVNLTAGQHVLRLVMDTNGGATAATGNFNFLSLTNNAIPTATATRTRTSGPAVSSTPTNTMASGATNTPTSTPTSGTGVNASTFYVLDGAALNVPGALSASQGAAAATDTIPSAGGQNYDGSVHNPLVYQVSGVSGTYDSSRQTNFSLYLDAGSGVGAGVQAKVSYDFTGDGTWDRSETYAFFATDAAPGWEQYARTAPTSTSGTFANLSSGKVKLELWNAIGNVTVDVRTSAPGATQVSSLAIPFAGGSSATNTPTATRTNTSAAAPTNTPTATRTNTSAAAPTSTPTATPTRTNTSAAAPTNTPTRTSTPGGVPAGTLYLADGAALNVQGVLSPSRANAESNDSIPSAAAQNYIGTVHDPLVYVVSGVNGTYNASKQTSFTLFLDAETAVGCAVQVRVSYDFTGDGTWDRLELFGYFPTNAGVDWELFQSGAAPQSTSGSSFANLSGGKVRVELWNALGNGPVKLRTGAPAGDANVSRISLPFN